MWAGALRRRASAAAAAAATAALLAFAPCAHGALNYTQQEAQGATAVVAEGVQIVPFNEEVTARKLQATPAAPVWVEDDTADFTTAGWSDRISTQLASDRTIHGPFAHGTVVSKTFSLPDHNKIYLSVRYWSFGSWDWAEGAVIQVDGVNVWRLSRPLATSSPICARDDQPSNRWEQFSGWVPGAWGNVVVVCYRDVDFGMLHNSPQLKLSFEARLNEAITDAGFSFSRFRLGVAQEARVISKVLVLADRDRSGRGVHRRRYGGEVRMNNQRWQPMSSSGMNAVAVFPDGSTSSASEYSWTTFVAFLEGLSQGTTVIIATHFNATQSMPVEAEDAIKDLGATLIDTLEVNGAYLLTGVKGGAKIAEKVVSGTGGAPELSTQLIHGLTDATNAVGPCGVEMSWRTQCSSCPEGTRRTDRQRRQFFGIDLHARTC